MSTEQSVDPELVEQTKQQIRGLVREIAQIAKSDVSPQDFYDAVLNRVVSALAAVGGAIWTVTETGQLTLEYQINLRETRLAESEDDQVKHGRLLRKVISSGEGMLMAPQSGAGDAEEGSNPTDFLLVLGPLKTAHETAGVMEVFQRPGGSVTVQRGYLRFLLQMCDLASEYLKSRKLQHFTDRQALWAQLEQFTRLVHKGLDPCDTAYTIANEGRRLIECDRVSVAVCRGRKCKIEAVSGQDTFDKRSNAIILLTRLARAVVATGEAMWYTGDTSMMAPQVEDAVQEYVDECHSKTVAVVPLKEPHDKTDPLAHPRVVGALIIEQIEDSRPSEGLPQRIDVVSEHSSLALTNVQEHNDLFLMPVWRAIGKSRWVLEARQLPWTITAVIALAVVSAFLCFWPANLELTARGTLQPATRRPVFANVEGEVTKVLVDHGDMVKKGQPLLEMQSSDLDVQFADAQGKLNEAVEESAAVAKQLSKHDQLKEGEEFELMGRRETLRAQIISDTRRLELLKIKQERLTVTSPIDGQVTTWHVRDSLIHRPVKIGDVLVTVVAPQDDWELELRLAEDRMGFVKDAQAKLGDELKVEYVTATNPGATHHGTVKEIEKNAQIRGEDGNTVLIRVAIDKNDVPDRRPGAGVTAQIDCGRTSVGYRVFHDLVSFVQRLLFKIT
jgi:multidrug efflux pump subunit AcrA (membrane-fusion protein)